MSKAEPKYKVMKICTDCAGKQLSAILLNLHTGRLVEKKRKDIVDAVSKARQAGVTRIFTNAAVKENGTIYATDKEVKYQSNADGLAFFNLASVAQTLKDALTSNGLEVEMVRGRGASYIITCRGKAPNVETVTTLRLRNNSRQVYAVYKVTKGGNEARKEKFEKIPTELVGKLEKAIIYNTTGRVIQQKVYSFMCTNKGGEET